MVADDCVTRLALVPVVTEVIFSCEHGRLVNEKPTNAAIIIRQMTKHKFINRESLMSSSDFSISVLQQPTCGL